MSKIVLENVTYFHGKDTPYEIKALEDINLNIPSGKITGIIGHTGSGKSTLVQLFNGLLRPESGRVLLDGVDIWSQPKKIRDIRFKVGLVMQYPEYQLFEETVAKDIAYGPKNMGLDDEEISKRVEEAAEFSGLDKELLDRSPFDLSGGQKRRAAIAGIIAMRPDVLVLDEPAAGLNNIVEYQRKSGSTVVIVSHSMEDMARLCDNLVVMSSGRVFMTGDRNEIFKEADKLTSVGLDVPQITQLITALSKYGIEIDCGIYTVEQAYQFIKKKLDTQGKV